MTTNTPNKFIKYAWISKTVFFIHLIGALLLFFPIATLLVGGIAVGVVGAVSSQAPDPAASVLFVTAVAAFIALFIIAYYALQTRISYLAKSFTGTKPLPQNERKAAKELKINTLIAALITLLALLAVIPISMSYPQRSVSDGFLFFLLLAWTFFDFFWFAQAKILLKANPPK